MPETLSFQEPLEKSVLEETVEVLDNRGVILYPTDTVYGLGCDITSKEAVARIFSLKKRDSDTPLSIAVSDVEMMKAYVQLGSREENYVRERVPGPYTFILQKKETVFGFVTSELPTVGIRVPECSPLLSLLQLYDKPIITTSANISGEKPPASLEDVGDEMKNKVDLILDGGQCRTGNPSTIIDLTKEGRDVIRP
ncbi:L-threonylcarbamoyladenylate synthase [Candidatus Altiarchaeota archaeon]